MKILVVNNMVPFLRGGAEELATHLVLNLKQHGHQADLLRIPFAYHKAEQIYDEMLACRMLQLYDTDLVIALKFPAYLIPHHNKVLWLVHQYRQAYDLSDTKHTNIAQTPDGEMLRQCIREADNECFRSVQKIHTVSAVTQRRLKVYNNFESDLLHPPLNDPERFTADGYRDYIFCGGRINVMKRQYLLVEAMRWVRSKVKLVIAGPADEPSHGEMLKSLIEKYKLSDRIQLHLGFQPREKISQWVSQSLATAYLPVDEDSYGYCVMESFQASKAALTATDSGGVLGLVTHDQTGWVSMPEPRQLAVTLDSIFENRQRTIEMGWAANECWLSKEISWDRTIERLVA